MATRLRTDERGLGLVELLIAMVVLNIGILATVATFNAGALALKRASQTATASTVADAQMERYRAMLYEEVGLDPDAVAAADADPVYRDDAARHYGTKSLFIVSCTVDVAGEPAECNPSRTVVGPDAKPYRVDTYIFKERPASDVQRDVKVVTVVVRDGAATSKVLVRTQSTFDESRG